MEKGVWGGGCGEVSEECWSETKDVAKKVKNVVDVMKHE